MFSVPEFSLLPQLGTAAFGEVSPTRHVVSASLWMESVKNHHFPIISLDNTGGGYIKIVMDKYVRRVTQPSEPTTTHFIIFDEMHLS